MKTETTIIAAAPIAAAPTATKKPATKRATKPAAPDYSTTITGTTLYPEYTGNIPAALAAKYPGFQKIAARYATHGLTRIKFFFTYSPDTKKPGRRTGDQFYITPARYAGKIVPIPAGLFVSARHKITGKIFFKLFPEIAPLFASITKSGGGNFILNIAAEHRDKPKIRREHIIRSASADTDLD